MEHPSVCLVTYKGALQTPGQRLGYPDIPEMPEVMTETETPIPNPTPTSTTEMDIMDIMDMPQMTQLVPTESPDQGTLHIIWSSDIWSNWPYGQYSCGPKWNPM